MMRGGELRHDHGGVCSSRRKCAKYAYPQTSIVKRGSDFTSLVCVTPLIRGVEHGCARSRAKAFL